MQNTPFKPSRRWQYHPAVKRYIYFRRELSTSPRMSISPPPPPPAPRPTTSPEPRSFQAFHGTTGNGLVYLPPARSRPPVTRLLSRWMDQPLPQAPQPPPGPKTVIVISSDDDSDNDNKMDTSPRNSSSSRLDSLESVSDDHSMGTLIHLQNILIISFPYDWLTN